MGKVALVLFASLAFFIQTSTALKCYRCNEGCPVDRAETITCGMSIGPAQEAFCVKRPRSGNTKDEEPVRKCEIVAKGTKQSTNPCPPNDSECYCNEDMCNSSSSINFNSFIIIGLVLACFVH